MSGYAERVQGYVVLNRDTGLFLNGSSYRWARWGPIDSAKFYSRKQHASAAITNQRTYRNLQDADLVKLPATLIVREEEVE